MRRPLACVLLLGACSHAPQKPEPAPRAEEPIRAASRPSADDEMTVAGTLGTLSDEEIAGPFQRRWDDITACYQGEKAKLKYLAGRVELKLRVGQGGELLRAVVASSTLGNYEAERCILGVARELAFSRPHGGSEAEFTYPIEFRGSAPLHGWDPARLAPHLAKPQAKRDLAACKRLSPSGLPPQLSLTVYVGPGGKITSAGLSAEAPLEDAFASCLAGKARTWRVEDPLGKIVKATASVLE